MTDQAESLRKQMSNEQVTEAKVIAVVSGKGGVGKSNVSLSFAISLAQLGKRVAIFDLDIGMANLDILMGVTAQFHLVHLLESELTIWDVMEEGPGNISYFAGGTGFSSLFQLDQSKLSRFLEQLHAVSKHFDYILLDMGAGATAESMQFVLASHQIFLVTTPEPTAMTDGYAMLKYIHLHDQSKPISLIVNRAESKLEGKQTLDNFARVTKQFLNREIELLGVLPLDEAVTRAVKSQIPFVLFNKHAAVSRAIRQMAETYLGTFMEETDKRSLNFIERMRYLFYKKKESL